LTDRYNGAILESSRAEKLIPIIPTSVRGAIAMTAYIIWIIGILFTAGIRDGQKKEYNPLKLMFIWPLTLGSIVGEILSKPSEDG